MGRDNAGNIVPHCRNPKTNDKIKPCPKGQIIGKNGKCTGTGKFPGGGKGPDSEQGDGPTGQGPLGGFADIEEPEFGGMSGSGDKPKPGGQPSAGGEPVAKDEKDNTEKNPDDKSDKDGDNRVFTSLTADDLEPFRRLDDIYVFYVGKSRRKQYLTAAVDAISDIQGITDPKDIEKLKTKIKKSNYVLIIKGEPRYKFYDVTRTDGSGLDAILDKSLSNLTKLNDKRAKVGGGLSYMFNQLMSLNAAIGTGAATWKQEGQLSFQNKLTREYLMPAFKKAMEIVHKNPNKDKDEVQNLIRKDFEEVYDPEDQKRLLKIRKYQPDADSKESPAVADKKQSPTRRKIRESKTMNKNDLRQLIKEAFTDKVYGNYPYSHKSGQEGEPAEDYTEDWKMFCSQVSQDKSKEIAIELAKMLVKDTDLLQDVLELIGQNQSVGSAILKKMEKSEIV